MRDELKFSNEFSVKIVVRLTYNFQVCCGFKLEHVGSYVLLCANTKSKYSETWLRGKPLPLRFIIRFGNFCNRNTSITGNY